MTQVLEPTRSTSMPRGLPVWASVLIIACAVASAAGAVYWYFKAGPLGGEAVVLDRGPEDGVKTLAPDKNWRAISGNAVLRVTRDRKGELQPAFDFLHYDFLPPEQFAALNNGRRLAIDSAMAQEVGLSDQQIAKIRESVRRGFKIEISDADKQRLLALFKEYLDASGSSRESRETALLRAMEEIGDRTAAAARQATSDAAAQIKSALTPQQWQKFDQIGQ
jgi:hypothetical protein